MVVLSIIPPQKSRRSTTDAQQGSIVHNATGS
jgi:hypothetical protein